MAGIETQKDNRARIYVIGAGISPENIPASYLEIIQRAGVLVGGKRLLTFFSEHQGLKIEIHGDIDEVFNKVREYSDNKGDVVILASGDPLFFGIAARVLNEFDREIIEILPNISSIQQVFAKIKEPWQNVPTITLHGKKQRLRYFEIIRHFKNKNSAILILTDRFNSPNEIAGFLIENGLGSIKMIVAEELGSERERLTHCLPSEILQTQFSNLNVVILKNEHPEAINFLSGTGLDDSLYKHEKGLITKSEIRAVILSRLNLQKSHIFWDIGAGSGAISIEAANFIKPENIYAIEKDPLRCEDIKENMHRFYLNNINLINAAAPECLRDLPCPDRVFIGGSNGKIDKILDIIIEKINKNGKIIISAVLLDTIKSLLNYLDASHDIGFEVLQISLHKSENLGKSLFLKPYNPCWLFLLDF